MRRQLLRYRFNFSRRSASLPKATAAAKATSSHNAVNSPAAVSKPGPAVRGLAVSSASRQHPHQNPKLLIPSLIILSIMPALMTVVFGVLFYLSMCIINSDDLIRY